MALKYIGNEMDVKKTKDFLKTQNINKLKTETQEFKDTGSFSKGLEKQFDMSRGVKAKAPNEMTNYVAPNEMNTKTETPTVNSGPGSTTPIAPTKPLEIKPTKSNIPNVSPTPLPGVTTEIGKVNGKDWELGQAELDVYNTLTPQQQDSFWLTRDQLDKNQTDYTKDLVDYLSEAQKSKDYSLAQREKTTRVNELTGEIQDIQASQTLQNGQDQIDILKQNIAYIGSQGAPGVSSTKLDAIAKQVSNAEKTFEEMQVMQSKTDEIRELGLEFDTAKFEKEMADFQTKLDSEVNTTIQSAFNSLLEADVNGKLDTIEEIEAMKKQVLANMDKEIEGVTDKNFQERTFLIEQANLNIENSKKQIAEYKQQQQEYQENKNIVNTQMSGAQGYYVDGNGNPIISSTTGTSIQIPEQSPMDPIFNKDTGQLVQFSTDENGNIVANVDQVIDQPTFEQNTITSYANLVGQGKLDINDVPEQVRNTDTFLSTLEQVKAPLETMSPYQQAQIDLQKQKYDTDIQKYNIEQQNAQTMTPYQQAQIDLDKQKLGLGNQDWTKLDDGTLYNKNTGETKDTKGNVVTTEQPFTYSGYADILQADIERLGGDNELTGETIENVANDYGVNPAFLAGILRNDSGYGKNMYSKYNYGNVGNNDTLVAEGKPGVTFNSSEEGVQAVASNIKKRINTYKSIYGDESVPTTKEILSGVAKDGKKFYGVYMTDKTAYDRVGQITAQLDRGIKTPTKDLGGETNGLKESYLERIKVGALTNSEYSKIQEIAQNDGWLDEYNTALKKGIKSNLTPTQQKAYEVMVDDITKGIAYKNMNIFKNGVDTVKSGLSQGNGLGDITAINAFQRMIDPGATVREGDVSLIQTAIPLSGKYSWDYLYGTLKTGDKLPDEVRAQLIKTASDLYNTRLNIYNDSSVKNYKKRAEGIGVELEMVPGLNFKKEELGENVDQDEITKQIDSFYGETTQGVNSDTLFDKYYK